METPVPPVFGKEKVRRAKRRWTFARIHPRIWAFLFDDPTRVVIPKEQRDEGSAFSFFNRFFFFVYVNVYAFWILREVKISSHMLSGFPGHQFYQTVTLSPDSLWEGVTPAITEMPEIFQGHNQLSPTVTA